MAAMSEGRRKRKTIAPTSSDDEEDKSMSDPDDNLASLDEDAPLLGTAPRTKALVPP